MDLMIGADHAGFELKELLLKPLSAQGVRWKDVGTFSSESVDYPDFAFKVAQAVSKGRATFGLLICGTGIGMSITANRLSGVRAALCNDLYTARMARAHNNANILALGSRVVGFGLAQAIVQTFMETTFEKGRHLRRIKKMDGGCS
ncbi:MAG: ribose 5-phosphate isomerase B [Deltaproteobacteria bacterium RBG_13_43_22]|nr:MAG: ribose 5-phosphate isomerase B [Deltaproteobacteria bacterium RBG_13_43_22]